MKPKKPYILKISPEDVSNKYLELQNIKMVAKYFNADPCTMARYFNRNNIQYIHKHKNNFNESFFAQNTPESFYLAGFIAADGNVSKIKNHITIALHEKDGDFLENIKYLIKFEGELYNCVVYNSKRNIKWRNSNNKILRFTSEQTVNDLRRFNIVPNKTKIYDMPEWLIEHPLVSHYMRGYNDGDGHIGLKNNKKLRFCLVGNYLFLLHYQSILEKNCDIRHNQIFTRPNNLSVLEYQGNIIVPKICNFLYNNSTFHMDRKFNVYKNWLDK